MVGVLIAVLIIAACNTGAIFALALWLHEHLTQDHYEDEEERPPTLSGPNGHKVLSIRKNG